MNAGARGASQGVMNGRARGSMWLVGTLLAAALGMAGEARASHYALDQVNFVTAGERKALARAGILDSEVLLAWTARADKRRWLAKTTRIGEARLGVLARRCDLLRVAGMGPAAVAVLGKAGIEDTRALARAIAEPLVERMRARTRGTALAARLPAVDTVAAWIAEARLLRPIVE